uniref:Uncharacterized protein n=1 Tax=Oryza sativa subsp. japonica TaxID=39947 RepID=Q7EY00_ORYSJ|nr:hypothetical protein [Oryza sativa Japonica Group]
MPPTPFSFPSSLSHFSAHLHRLATGGEEVGGARSHAAGRRLLREVGRDGRAVSAQFATAGADLSSGAAAASAAGRRVHVRRPKRGRWCLVAPSSPTPAETLPLSVIDRVAGLRHLVRSLHVFEAGGGGGEPARVVREALGKALVEYHPFAGRFVEVVGVNGGGEVAVVGRWLAGCNDVVPCPTGLLQVCRE